MQSCIFNLEKRLHSVNAEIDKHEAQANILTWIQFALGARALRKAGRIQQEMVRLKTRKRHIERKLKRFRTCDPADFAKHTFENIRSVARVRDVHVLVEPMRLRILTDDLYSLNTLMYPPVDTPNWHHVGQLCMIVDIQTEDPSHVLWRNQTYPKAKTAAPQISAMGFVPCFGAVASDLLTDAFADGCHDIVVSVLVRFAEMPHHDMRHFPIVPEENVPAWYRETKMKW